MICSGTVLIILLLFYGEKYIATKAIKNFAIEQLEIPKSEINQESINYDFESASFTMGITPVNDGNYHYALSTNFWSSWKVNSVYVVRQNGRVTSFELLDSAKNNQTKKNILKTRYALIYFNKNEK